MSHNIAISRQILITLTFNRTWKLFWLIKIPCCCREAMYSFKMPNILISCDNIHLERLKVVNFTERSRKARLRWFGHVKRRDNDYVGRKTLEMVLPGRRKRGRLKQRWMDCVNRDMRAIGTTKDEVHDRIAGGELCLPQRLHNQVGAARRRRCDNIQKQETLNLSLGPFVPSGRVHLATSVQCPPCHSVYLSIYPTTCI